MDNLGVHRIFGRFEESGHATFQWDASGQLILKELYSDPQKNNLIYKKAFTWNLDGSLSHWILTVITTGEQIRKNFNFNAQGQVEEFTAQ